MAGINERSKPLPSEKKNKIKKKSLSGFRLSAIYWEMGLVAIEIPATKAPISRDRPEYSASSAIPKHQPNASKNTYSPIRSNLANRGCRTIFTATKQPPTKAGRATRLLPNGSRFPLLRSPDISNSNTKIARKSCISSMPTINSPECL